MENIEYGGFWRRFLATIIDGLISAAVAFVIVYVILYSVFPISEDEMHKNFYDIVDGLFTLIYGLLLPVLWSGFTVGKYLLGIKIQQVNGDEVTFWTMIKRFIIANIIYAISLGILVIVSFFMVIIREDKRAIHDFVAGTHVIRV